MTGPVPQPADDLRAEIAAVLKAALGEYDGYDVDYESAADAVLARFPADVTEALVRNVNLRSEQREEREHHDRQFNEVSQALDEALTQVAKWKLLYEQRDDADILTRQRDEARAEVRSMVVNLHAAVFEGSALLPDRPLDTVWEYLLGLVREDAARRSGRGEVPDDAVQRVADEIKTYVEESEGVASNGNCRVIATVAVESLKGMLAESGWAVTTPTDGEAGATAAQWKAAYEAKLADFARETLRTSRMLQACERSAMPVHVVGEAILGYWFAQEQIRAAGQLPAGPVVPAPTEDPLANDPALAVLRAKLKPEECGASEGGMGVDCQLPPGHDGWHNGSHTPFTDGTESIGYPFDIQWPRNEYDRCAPPAPLSTDAEA